MGEKTILHEVELNISGPSGQSGFGLGGFGEGGFGVGEAGTITYSYFYALTDHPARSVFVAKLQRPLDLNRALPVPGQRGDSFLARTAQVEMSNNPVGDLAETPTVSYLRQSAEIRGQLCKCRISIAEDTGAGISVTTLLELVGRIGALSTLNRQTAAFPVAITDQSLRSKKIPARTTLSVFPSADVSNVSGQDHPIIWVFGDKCLVELALVLGANFIRCNFTLTGGGDQYRYVDLTSIADTPISSGYYLEYDVQWDQPGARIALDLECTDTTRLKNQSVNDQNGFSAAPTTNLGDKPVKAFYRRRVSLASLNGKTASKFMVGCENDTPGSYSGRIAQAVIVDSQGTVIREIVTRRQTSFTTATAYDSNPGNTSTITKNNRDFFGGIKGSSGITLHAIFRNSGVVPSGEYSLVNMLDLKLVRFGDLQPQVDVQGRTVKILALLSTSEYGGNPATIRRAILSDLVDGAGQPVDESTFATAATDYSDAEVSMGGGLDRQWALPELLAATSYLGAYLWRDSNGYFQEIVDKAARYSDAPIDLEEGTEKSLNNLLIKNAVDSSHTPVQQLTVRGYQSRGINNQESWLLRTIRRRDPAIEGGVDLTLDFPFLVDPDALDRAAHYEWEQLLGYDKRLEAEMTRLDDAVSLALYHRPLVYAPSLFIDAVRYFIREQRISGNAFSWQLQIWRASAYSYVQGTEIFIDSKASIEVDYSQTFPTSPTNFVAGTPVIRPSGTGELEAVTPFTADAPSANVTHLVFRLLLATTLKLIDEIARPCVAGEIGVEAGFSLFADNAYIVQCFARNETNLPAFRNGALATSLNITGPANTIPPTAPIWSTLTQGSNSQITGQVVIAPESDVSRYHIYRSLTENTADMVLIQTSTTPAFVDSNFGSGDAGKRIYYAVKSQRAGGAFSAFSLVRDIVFQVAAPPPPPGSSF